MYIKEKNNFQRLLQITLKFLNYISTNIFVVIFYYNIYLSIKFCFDQGISLIFNSLLNVSYNMKISGMFKN